MDQLNCSFWAQFYLVMVTAHVSQKPMPGPLLTSYVFDFGIYYSGQNFGLSGCLQ